MKSSKKARKLATMMLTVVLGSLLLMNCQSDDSNNDDPVNPVNSDFTIAPEEKNYGEVKLGETAEQTFTITNKGTAALNLKSFVLSGTNKAAFSTNGTALKVAVGKNQPFKVTFAPKSKGEKTATLKVITDSAGTKSIELKGVGKENSESGNTQSDMGKDVKIRFLHHSTGKHIWNGGVADWFVNYNKNNNTKYDISEVGYPAQPPYPEWANYPYDYWSIWVKNAGEKRYLGQETLEMLTKDYNVIVWKHCYPVSNIHTEIDGEPNIESKRKSLGNYKLQYEALKKKMAEFPNTRFIVWTGAVKLKSELPEEQAKRAKEFFTWVKEEWDEKGDNIYIFDFYELETEGGLYLKPEYAFKPGDSHPHPDFAKKVAPKFSKRIVDVIQGKADNTNLTGE